MLKEKVPLWRALCKKTNDLVCMIKKDKLGIEVKFFMQLDQNM